MRGRLCQPELSSAICSVNTVCDYIRFEPRRSEKATSFSIEGRTYYEIPTCPQRHPRHCHSRKHRTQSPQDIVRLIILTSPGVRRGDGGSAALLKEPRWSCSTLCMVVDEVHCIKRRGSEFRKNYVSMETFSSFAPLGGGGG